MVTPQHQLEYILNFSYFEKLTHHSQIAALPSVNPLHTFVPPAQQVLSLHQHPLLGLPVGSMGRYCPHPRPHPQRQVLFQLKSVTLSFDIRSAT